VVAGGLAASGIATYAFFAVASRSLEPDRYAAVGVLWSLLFAVGNGVMQPLEQEVARAVSDRRARGIGPGPVIRRAAAIGAAFTAVLVLGGAGAEVLAGLGWWPQVLTVSRLLDGNTVLVVGFLVGLVGFCVGHLARGTLSSHGRFGRYALFFTADGVGRVVLAAVLAVVGVAGAGPWGLVLAVAPFLGAGAALAGQKGLLEAGPPASYRELTRALGWLLAGTVSLALVVQGGTIAVDILASDAEAAAAGVFLNGLVIARIPLFLFQAVLASLLPRLSRLAGSGAYDEFRATLNKLVGAILAVGLVTTALAAVAGPSVIDIMFGSTTTLGARDLALLAFAFIVIMASICMDQAIIALNGHKLMAIGWMVALGVFAVVTLLGDDLFLRVELGLVAAAVFAFGWLWVCLGIQLRRHPKVGLVSLAEAVAEAPLQE
jgi:O-antigen/teichoic acid export membrane protein